MRRFYTKDLAHIDKEQGWICHICGGSANNLHLTNAHNFKFELDINHAWSAKVRVLK